MSAFGYSLGGFLVVIAILVTVHEFGHFWVARKLGIKVLKFSIGFGRPIFVWNRSDDPTEYSIGIIPLGGYVKMLDEREAPVSEVEIDQAFNRKSVAVRSAVVIAGPAFNFLFAIFAIWVVFVAGSRDIDPVVGEVLENSIAEEAGFQPGDRMTAIDGRSVSTWGQHQLYMMHQAMKGNSVIFSVDNEIYGNRDIKLNFGSIDQKSISGQPLSSVIGIWPTAPEALVSTVIPGKPAEKVGLKAGDLILAINGNPVKNWVDMATQVSQRPGEQMTFTVQRKNQIFDVNIIPDTVLFDEKEYGQIGVTRPELKNVMLQYGPLESVWQAIDYNWRITIVTLRSLGRMLTAQMSSDNLSGPITIARLAGRTAASGYADFLKFLAIISISLGLLNLLPIPILDGGHLMYILYEAVTGNEPSEQAMMVGQKIGILIIIFLTILAFYNDIMRLL